ncbi:hypothetical protein RRG08_058214 [Elysia crispata]|uniref:Uncharacterized protein n=1 Tax=Elysia crispata TaxID=231223 RepID=A0AAE0XYR9_9GAST|nr:hypothetical protein RRG08_058214 [Elysia crispata]
MAPLRRFFSRGSVIFSANSGSTQTPSSASYHSDSVSLAGSPPLLALQSFNLLTVSEDRSRGLNSGLGLYNGLPQILKLDCVHGLRHLAQFLVGSVEVCNRLAREAGALVDAQRLSHICTIPFESRGFEELPRPILVG